MKPYFHTRYSPLLLLFKPCRGLTNEVAAQFFSSNIVAQPITWLHNCVTMFAIIAVMSFRDITCELIPGSPPPFLFFVGARGEPGNEAKTGPRGHRNPFIV